MKILCMFLFGGILLTAPAFANEFCGREYQICLENFVPEPMCAEGKKRCEAARKEPDATKKEAPKDKNDKAPKKEAPKDR